MATERTRKIFVDGFSCPVCLGSSYEAIELPTYGDNRYAETGMYRCSGCGFGFLNPQRYIKQSPAKPE